MNAEDWKNFVESWRCRICKKDLNLDNFGGLGPNHFIGCSECLEKYPQNFSRDKLKG
jgi:hypothetical protein